MAGTKFEVGTAVERRTEAPGAYRALIGEEWNCPVVPHGGLVTATTVRAMIAELADPDQTLRSVTTVFAAQVQAGPVDIDVTLLRRGRSVSQLSATARSPGADAGHTTVAVFGRPRDGFAFTDSVPPTVPQPDECPSFRDPLPEGVVGDIHMNFWEHLEGRPASGHPPWEEYIPASSERSAWYRFDEPPMLDDGRLDPLAVLTMCDTMPGAVSERMGRRDQVYLPPSCDLTVHMLDDAHTEWVLAVNRARYAGDGYASTEMEIWDATLEHLVAYATQQMFFVFPDGPPPPEVRPTAQLTKYPARNDGDDHLNGRARDRSRLPAAQESGCAARARAVVRDGCLRSARTRERARRSPPLGTCSSEECRSPLGAEVGPVDTEEMATWWDQRETWVNDAIAMVAAQRHCTHAEAIAVLRRRAEVMDADLEAAAHALVDSGSRLGHRDFGPSRATDAADEAVESVPFVAT